MNSLDSLTGSVQNLLTITHIPVSPLFVDEFNEKMFETQKIVIGSIRVTISLIRRRGMQAGADEIMVVQEKDGVQTVVLPLTSPYRVKCELIYNYEEDSVNDDYASYSTLTLLHYSIAFWIDGRKQEPTMNNLFLSKSNRQLIKEWLKLPVIKRHQIARSRCCDMFPVNHNLLDRVAREADMYD